MTELKTALREAVGHSGMRGAGGGAEQRPISAAVVIGVGGSGIQTIARLRSALRAGRVDQRAVDAVSFLGIDSVSQERMMPPLPANVELAAGEYLNILGNAPVNGRQFVEQQLQGNAFLQQWWDPAYEAPDETLDRGLKRERMLGRLAFTLVREELVTKIQDAIRQAIKLDPAGGGAGNLAASIPVYIVASSAGGTGSAGFLEVVLAAWRAAREIGENFAPVIRGFVFLPTVFRGAVAADVNSEEVGIAHDANAFAFFREVDHYCVSGKTMERDFGVGDGLRIGNAVLKQVYVLDNILGTRGMVQSITDMYEIVSEALFHILMSDVGRQFVGENAANTEGLLEKVDRWDKPRRYCGLGIARVVHPGDTFRQHLRMGYVEWFLRSSLLAEPEDLAMLVPDHGVTRELTRNLNQTITKASGFTQPDDAASFLRLKSTVKAELERVPNSAEADKLIGQIVDESPRVVSAIEQASVSWNRRLVREHEETVVAGIFRSGFGIAFADEVLKILGKQIDDAKRRTVAQVDVDLRGVDLARGRAEDLLEELRNVERRALARRIAARVGGVVGLGRTPEAVAADLGASLQTWVQATVDSELAQARGRLLDALRERVDTLRRELRGARDRLIAIADDAKVLWEADELLGKDAGPMATTTLIPADAQPQVEWCGATVQWMNDIKAEHADRVRGEELTDFLTQWSGANGNRGLFSLGSDNANESAQAERSFVVALLVEAEERALFTRDARRERQRRLPPSLPEAAAADPGALRDGITRLTADSAAVCLTYDPGRLVLERPIPGQVAVGQVPPSTVTVIAHDESVRPLIDDAVPGTVRKVLVPDPERIVALSCQWGIPAHTISHMLGWRRDYEALAARRPHEKGRSRPAPNHIDKRFETMLAELVPVYFEAAAVGQQVGQALVFAKLLPDDRVQGLYDHDIDNPAHAPLARNANSQFVGHVVQITEGRLQCRARDTVDLGGTWAECLEEFGGNGRLGSSVTDLVTWLIETLGAQAVLGAVRSFLEVEIPRLETAYQDRPADAEAIAYVKQGLQQWAQQLNGLASFM